MDEPTSDFEKRIQTVIYKTGLAGTTNVGHSKPRNEEGVKEIFRAVAPTLSIEILVDTQPFPDMIINKKGQGPYILEVELSLSNFIDHNHEPRACDIVLFWDDDCVVLEEELERDSVPDSRKERIIQLLSNVKLLSLKEIIDESFYPITTGLEKRTGDSEDNV